MSVEGCTRRPFYHMCTIVQSRRQLLNWKLWHNLNISNVRWQSCLKKRVGILSKTGSARWKIRRTFFCKWNYILNIILRWRFHTHPRWDYIFTKNTIINGLSIYWMWPIKNGFKRMSLNCQPRITAPRNSSISAGENMKCWKGGQVKPHSSYTTLGGAELPGLRRAE